MIAAIAATLLWSDLQAPAQAPKPAAILAGDV